MPRLLPLLLTTWTLLGTGCAYLYSPPVVSEPYRAPAAVGPRQGELRGGVAFAPNTLDRVAGSVTGAIPVGRYWHLELGGGFSQEWALGRVGMRKSWRGERDERRVQTVGDLAVTGGLGAGGGYASGSYRHLDEVVPGSLVWETEAASWKERFAAGAAVELGLGARVDDAVTPFLRIRLQLGVTEDLPATLWGDLGCGVSLYPGRGPLGIDLSVALAGYHNREHLYGFVVGALGLSLALGPP